MVDVTESHHLPLNPPERGAYQAKQGRVCTNLLETHLSQAVSRSGRVLLVVMAVCLYETKSIKNR